MQAVTSQGNFTGRVRQGIFIGLYHEWVNGTNCVRASSSPAPSFVCPVAHVRVDAGRLTVYLRPTPRIKPQVNPISKSFGTSWLDAARVAQLQAELDAARSQAMRIQAAQRVRIAELETEVATLRSTTGTLTHSAVDVSRGMVNFNSHLGRFAKHRPASAMLGARDAHH